MRAPSDAEKAENRYLVDEWQHRNSVLPPGARSGGSKKHKKKLTKKHKKKLTKKHKKHKKHKKK